MSYHYDEEGIRARRGSQIKTIQAMTELLENYENEDYYRQSRRRSDGPELRTYQNNNQGTNHLNTGYQGGRAYPQNNNFSNNNNINNSSFNNNNNNTGPNLSLIHI